MGIGMGIIIVKTLQSHSPRLTIAPLRGPTHTRPGNLDLFFMKNCGVRGLSSHDFCKERIQSRKILGSTSRQRPSKSLFEGRAGKELLTATAFETVPGCWAMYLTVC